MPRPGDAILAEARLLFGYLGGVDPGRRAKTIDALRAELDRYDMTLRRYAPMKQSIGTVIPLAERRKVQARDNGCVGKLIAMPGPCAGAIELDHVRASHAMGMKSESTAANLASLCGAHHLWRTEHGREWRPRLLDYLARE